MGRGTYIDSVDEQPGDGDGGDNEDNAEHVRFLLTRPNRTLAAQ